MGNYWQQIYKVVQENSSNNWNEVEIDYISKTLSSNNSNWFYL